MIGRQAVMLVSDDFLMSLSGKFNLFGVYTGDIAIPNDATSVTQLVALFIAETDARDPFLSLTFEVSIPGETTLRQLPLPFPVVQQQAPPGRMKLTYRIPFLLSFVQLRPGQITGRVIHDKGAIEVGGPWVVVGPQPATHSGGV